MIDSKLSMKTHNLILIVNGAIIFYMTFDATDNQELFTGKEIFPYNQVMAFKQTKSEYALLGKKNLARRPK